MAVQTSRLDPAPPLAHGYRGHGWGPLVRRVACGSSRARWLAGGVALAAFGVLGLAAVLRPDPTGFGTHRQLGLPGCTFLLRTGYPCPTCGMTTAFAHASRGHWLTALRGQPMGFLMWLACLGTGIGGVSAVATGRTWTLNWFRVSPGWLVAVLVGLLLLSWAYTILTVVLPAR